MRRLGQITSAPDRLDIATRRERLRGRVEWFNATAYNMLPALQKIPITNHELLPLDDEESEDDEDPFGCGFEELFHGEPESRSLLLPSTLGKDVCIKWRLTDAMNKEMSLREGQANDALEGLRQGIGEKSFMYRERLRHARGIQQTTRARSGIRNIGRTLNNHRRVYGFARRALIALAGNEGTQVVKYQPVTLKDLKASTVIYDLNSPETRKTPLAWFWNAESSIGAPAEEGLLSECENSRLSTNDRRLTGYSVYRVHWLVAKAQYDRWTEEVQITSSEMEWTTRYFLTQSLKWSTRRDQQMAEGMNVSAGHVCYADRQACMWSSFAMHAQNRYQAVSASYQYISSPT